MNPVVKFLLFAALLVAVFAGGAAVGAVTHDDEPAPTHEVHEL